MTTEMRKLTRDDFTYHHSIPTRWNDNDMLGHLNNVVYYRLFETIVVKFLAEEIKLDWKSATENAQAVESLCRFHKALSYPDLIDAVLRVAKIGNSSVVFELALFGPEDGMASAKGHVVEVFVDTASGKSTSMGDHRREIFEKFTLSS